MWIFVYVMNIFLKNLRYKELVFNNYLWFKKGVYNIWGCSFCGEKKFWVKVLERGWFKGWRYLG